jgi:hypothetical protein
MLGQLRQATHGMVSDAQLVQTATDIISLGLADTGAGVVDLAALISELGWDMQTVIMTFANNSEMRLDQLGLSVEDVTARAKALEAAGLSASEAFDQAVIDAGREKLELLGSAAETTAGDIARAEVAWTNLIDQLKVGTAQAAGPALSTLNTLTEIRNEFILLHQQGAISEREFRAGIAAVTLGLLQGSENAQAYLDRLTAVNDEAAAADQVMRSYANSTVQAAEVVNTLSRVTEAWGTVNEDAHERARVAIEEEQALRDALARGYELTSTTIEENIRTNIAALEEERRAAEEAAIAYGRDFAAALEAGDDAVYDVNQQLFDQIAVLGAEPALLMAAGLALTDYSEDALKAALQQAAMNAAIAELAPLVANGTITIGDAVGALEDFETQLQQDYTAEMDTQSLVEARQLANDVKGVLDSIRGSYKAEVLINTVQTVTYSPGYHGLGTTGPQPTIGGVPELASGTGGWLTVPGAMGAPYPVILHGGEGVNVNPSGIPAGGGSSPLVVNQYFNNREAAALGLAFVERERRKATDAAWGYA